MTLHFISPVFNMNVPAAVFTHTSAWNVNVAETRLRDEKQAPPTGGVHAFVGEDL